MLFLGNEKYPTQDSYRKLIADNSGSSNAYTDKDKTVYMFQSSNSGFYKVLDCFANFFVAPLFTDSCTEREMKAVDSEHNKNL
jgi:insulysin